MVKYGSFEEIKEACIQNSYHWPKFKVMSLRINMRLERLRSTLLQKIAVINEKMNCCHDRGDMDQGSALIKEREQLLADETGQKEYAKMILQIGNGSQLNLFQSNPQAYFNTYNYKYENAFSRRSAFE